MASGGVSQKGLSPRLTAALAVLRQPPMVAAAALVEDDPYDCFDVARLERYEGYVDVLKAFVAAAEVKLARRRRDLAQRGQAAPVDRSANGMRSSREQRTAAGREDVCDRLPDVEAALAGGAIAAGHVDAIATATSRLSDDEKAKFDEQAGSLLDQATAESVDDFAKTCQNLARRVQADEGESKLNEQRRNNRVTHRVDQHTGMHHIHAELDPEAGAKVITAIRATVTSLKHHEQPAASAPEPVDPDAPLSERIAATVAHIESNLRNAATYDELMVQAFVELITGARAVDRRIPEICTLIDLHTLIDGLTSASICETSAGELLPPGTIRRLACDGNIIPIVLGGRSEVLDVGRSQRLATPAQRQALRAMYSTCVIPGCDVPFDRCEIHHVKPWAHDLGATDLADLAPVCGHDHHRLHEGGWRLDLAHDPERTVTLRRPDGTVEFEGPSIQRRTTRAA